MGTVVYVACNGVFEGAVVISDTIKDGAKEAIQTMKQVASDIRYADRRPQRGRRDSGTDTWYR